MPPGRKEQARKAVVAEEPLTEYEQVRAKVMMRNNQVLQRLGVNALVEILNNTASKSKGEGCEESGSLYDGLDSDDSDQDEVTKVAKDVSGKSTKRTVCTSARSLRASKRVVALDQQDEPIRVTRQKTREHISTLSPSRHEELTIGQITTTPANDAFRSGGSLDEQQGQGNTSAIVVGKDPHRIRGLSVGRDLERINRGLCTKLAIHIKEGKRRPEAPMQAAKLASEGGITLRQSVPIFTHWKHYKDKKNKYILDNYVAKVGTQFNMDTKDAVVEDACIDLLKGGQRQMRYKLKKKYFNGVPANQVRTTSPVAHMTDVKWKKLVDMWSGSEHKEKCIKYKGNREKVQFQQRTGSRCYIAQAHVVKQQKYKEAEPSAIDLFKDFHCSRITGFAEPVKKVIATMESILDEPVDEGQLPKSAADIVAQVVPTGRKFLKNVGMNLSYKKSNCSQVKELQAELQIERQEKTELRQQLDDLKMQSEAARAKQAEEIEALKRNSLENNSLLRQLLQFSQGHSNT
ncbi:hypothetical protein U9M48_036882, partial [Paspalum notatum var. saurae]